MSKQEVLRQMLADKQSAYKRQTNYQIDNEIGLK